MNGRAVLRFTPELLIMLLKRGELPRRLEVVQHALPDDAKLVAVDVDADGRDVLLEIESATFPASPGVVTELPSPSVRLNKSDTQIVHDACRLRAALLTLHGINDLPEEMVTLLRETAQYRLPECRS